MADKSVRKRSAVGAQAAILKAARDRFAEDGFERTTIRAIADDADLDPALVVRFFGSKERLLAAATDVNLRLPDVAAMPRDQIGDMLVRHYVKRWHEPSPLLAIRLRAAAANVAEAERLRETFALQVAPVIAALHPDEDEVQHQKRAGLIATQMLGLGLCLKVLKMDSVMNMTIDEVAAWIGPTIQRYGVDPFPS